MKNATADFGFDLTEETPGDLLFTYQQERYTTRTLLPTLVGSSLLGLMSLLLIQPRSLFTGLLSFGLVTFLIFSTTKFLYNINRKQRSFRVDAQAITVDGTRYDRQHVTALFLEEGKSRSSFEFKPVSKGYVVPVTLGGMAAASAMNAGHAVGQGLDAAGRRLKANIAAKNCKVLFRFGKKDVKLVKGVSANTAQVIIDKLRTL